MVEANRERYCGTLADVVGFNFAEDAPPEQEPPRTRERSRPEASPKESKPEPRPRPESEPEIVARRPEPETEIDRPARGIHPREPAARELGKGGSQHRYVQYLVKGLAEERGFRAVIEEPIQGGQVDVALHREGLSIACEISVTSKPEYEAQNLAKCLRGGFARVFAIATDQKRLRTIEKQARERLPENEITRILFLTPEQVAGALDELAAPAEEEALVRGYRVKVSRTVVDAAEAQDRRAAVAKVIAKSMQGLSRDE